MTLPQLFFEEKQGSGQFMKTLSFSLPFAGQNTKATPKPPLPDLLVVPDNVNKGQPLR